MAINIFQGGKPSKSKSNATSRSVRAQNAQGALTGASVASDSGTTAVGKSGTLSKVGGFIGKAANVASKFLPGVGGTIAKGLANIFNDPEWWQSVPGDAVSLNMPLRVSSAGDDTGYAFKIRYAIGEFQSLDTSDSTHPYVIEPTDTQVTQYLMPEVRKAVNAIPLQTAAAYREVLQANATLYAIWQNFKRYDYMLKHGQTYIANLDDVGFPILQVANAANLQSMIGRLEEYLRANVRLPHTLCEYLAWRFGRVYKSNSSAKSALMLYNVLGIETSMTDYNTKVGALMSVISSTPALQQANADLYNTFFDHDFMVDIKEDTQFKYDVKEFCLRTNLDIRNSWPSGDPEKLDCVYIDSALDNPTTYMASTVSTVGGDLTGGISWLFPVRKAAGYIPQDSMWVPPMGDSAVTVGNYRTATTPYTTHDAIIPVATGSKWFMTAITEHRRTVKTYATGDELSVIIGIALACKSLDIYNKDVYVPIYSGDSSAKGINVDVTSLSMDLGQVFSTTLGNEHVYAFANLVAIGRKHSMSYKEAETLVSRDTANLVEKLDIGTSR